MWHDYNPQQHHIRFAVAVAKLKLAVRNKPAATVDNDLHSLRDAMENYIRAKGDWATTNTDGTLHHLVGTWSRVSRILRDIEERYK